MCNDPTRRGLARMRMRRNVITATGHFVSWLLEFIIFGVAQGLVAAHKESEKTSH